LKREGPLTGPGDEADQRQEESGRELHHQGDAEECAAEEFLEAPFCPGAIEEEAERGEAGGEGGDFQHAGRAEFDESWGGDDYGGGEGGDEQSACAQGEEEQGGEEDCGKQNRDEPGRKNRGGDMLEDLGDEKRMQRGLVIPDLTVHFEPFDAELGFGQVESFIGADLNCGAKRDEALESYEEAQQDNEYP